MEHYSHDEVAAMIDWLEANGGFDPVEKEKPPAEPVIKPEQQEASQDKS